MSFDTIKEFGVKTQNCVQLKYLAGATPEQKNAVCFSASTTLIDFPLFKFYLFFPKQRQCKVKKAALLCIKSYLAPVF